MLVLFRMKDAHGARTCGRWIFGLSVIERTRGGPIRLAGAFNRNLPRLLPFMPLIVGFQLLGGHLIGDGYSNSKMIWRRYADRPVFGPEERAYPRLHIPPGPSSIRTGFLRVVCLDNEDPRGLFGPTSKLRDRSLWLC
jgi:hypothetical protein